MFSFIIIVLVIALIVFIIVQHMDTHDEQGNVIEAAPMMTSKTVWLAGSEAVGISAGATAATVVKAVSADKDRRAAGAESLAASEKFQNFGTSTAYNRTYGVIADKIDGFLYNKEIS